MNIPNTASTNQPPLSINSHNPSSTDLSDAITIGKDALTNALTEMAGVAGFLHGIENIAALDMEDITAYAIKASRAVRSLRAMIEGTTRAN